MKKFQGISTSGRANIIMIWWESVSFREVRPICISMLWTFCKSKPISEYPFHWNGKQTISLNFEVSTTLPCNLLIRCGVIENNFLSTYTFITVCKNSVYCARRGRCLFTQKKCSVIGALKCNYVWLFICAMQGCDFILYHTQLVSSILWNVVLVPLILPFCCCQ